MPTGWQASPSRTKPPAKDDDNFVPDHLGSREGRTMMNTVVRGVFGMPKER